MVNRIDTPSISSDLSDEDSQRLFNESVKECVEVLEGKRGDGLDRALTARDLAQAGIINITPSVAGIGGSNDGIGIVAPQPIVEFPTTPNNLTAAAAFTNVGLSWDKATFQGYSGTEIWRYETNSLASAVLIATVKHNKFSDPVEPASTFYYWIRFVNTNNQKGSFNASSGTVGVTNQVVSKLIDDLNDATNNSVLSQSLRTQLNSTITSSTQPTAHADGRLLTVGDRWIDSGNSDAHYLWNGSAWGLLSLATNQYVDSEISTVSSTVDGHTSTLSTQASSINGLSAQYTVKIDTDGKVVGYGLASGVGSVSEFAVNVDHFKVASPSGDIVPFQVVTGSGVGANATGMCVLLDGSTSVGVTQTACEATYGYKAWIPAGAYITNAMIMDASIDSAKIKTLTVDVANVTGLLNSTGKIDANIIDANSITAGNIDLDDYLDFSSTASGIRFNKETLNSPTAGAFYGRGTDSSGNSIAGFHVSSATGGIYADSTGLVTLQNVRMFTGGAGTPLGFELLGQLAIPQAIHPNTTHIDIVVTGAGGGACNNASGVGGSYPAGTTQKAGNAGQASWLEFRTYPQSGGVYNFNGSYTVKGSRITAAGGAGASFSVGSNLWNYGTRYTGKFYGANGQASIHANSAGAAGYASYNQGNTGGANGYRGGGGGGPSGGWHQGGSSTAPSTSSAPAGTTVSGNYATNGATHVVVFIGEGGTSGTFTYPSTNSVANGYQPARTFGGGGRGGHGYVTIADPNSGGIETDFQVMLNRISALETYNQSNP